MKKRIISTLALFALVLSFASCRLAAEHEITYDYGGARENLTVVIRDGSLIPSDTPTRSGYTFGGWYTNESFTKTYDFSYPPTSDTTIYAKWIPKSDDAFSYEALVNEITQSTVKATVRFSVTKYNEEPVSSFIGGFLSTETRKVDVSTSYGSGVIYAEKSGYYYCLTNNHVVAKGEKAKAEIVITDYQLTSYTAELVASDENYDLAVVRFKKNATKPLSTLEVGDGEVGVGSTVVAIGSPNSQMNAITLGTVDSLESVAVDESKKDISNVKFPVIKHNAPMDNGSSGGALLNAELKLVGINFAASSSDGEFMHGFAVPLAKVKEFLTKNGLKF